MNKKVYKAAEFSPNVNKKQLSMITRNIIADTLNNTEEWFINQKKFQSQKWDQIFSLITKMSGKKIIFDWNQENFIIEKVIHINFVNLKHISFCANCIISIECLNRLQAPNLKELSLTNNRITYFRSFRKSHLPQLQVLDIFNNESKEPQPLVQLHVPHLFKLSIQMTSVHSVMGEDLRWAFKLQSNHLKWIWAISRYRMAEEKLGIAFRRRGVQGGLLK